MCRPRFLHKRFEKRGQPSTVSNANAYVRYSCLEERSNPIIFVGDWMSPGESTERGIRRLRKMTSRELGLLPHAMALRTILFFAHLNILRAECCLEDMLPEAEAQEFAVRAAAPARA